MYGLLVITVLIILLVPYFKRSKFKEIERQQAMRQAMMKLQEKYRHVTL